MEVAQVCLAFKLNVGFHFGTIHREISRNGNEMSPSHAALSESEVSTTILSRCGERVARERDPPVIGEGAFGRHAPRAARVLRAPPHHLLSSTSVASCLRVLRVNRPEANRPARTRPPLLPRSRRSATLPSWGRGFRTPRAEAARVQRVPGRPRVGRVQRVPGRQRVEWVQRGRTRAGGTRSCASGLCVCRRAGGSQLVATVRDTDAMNCIPPVRPRDECPLARSPVLLL